RDGGTLANRVIEEAGRFGSVTPLETDETDEALLQGQDVVLTIPDGFTEALLNGETPRLSFSATEGSDAALIEQALNSHLSRER
ncbi:hypothetical protein NL354_29410, partial [Klebsiella pneumoniae]|nr:hypothetical protein [Klebsiella pneumoniae]